MDRDELVNRLLAIENVVAAINTVLDTLLPLIEARETQRQADMRAIEALVEELRELARVVEGTTRRP